MQTKKNYSEILFENREKNILKKINNAFNCIRDTNNKE